jgi:hypothetical protein
MWTSILGFLDGAFRLANGLLDWWNKEAIKESGIRQEQLKSVEKTLERVRISNEVDLEPLPSSKHIILSGM